MKAHRAARPVIVLLVGALLAVLAGCDSGGSGSDAGATPSGTGAVAPPPAAPVGTGPSQFRPAVVVVCAGLATASPAPADTAARVRAVTDAQHAVEAVPNRTAGEDQLLRFLTVQLAWLQAVQRDGLGRAGPPPALPPPVGACLHAAATLRP